MGVVYDAIADRFSRTREGLKLREDNVVSIEGSFSRTREGLKQMSTPNGQGGTDLFQQNP